MHINKYHTAFLCAAGVRHPLFGWRAFFLSFFAGPAFQEETTFTTPKAIFRQGTAKIDRSHMRAWWLKNVQIQTVFFFFLLASASAFF